jgi:hypothetical protein
MMTVFSDAYGWLISSTATCSSSSCIHLAGSINKLASLHAKKCSNQLSLMLLLVFP